MHPQPVGAHRHPVIGRQRRAQLARGTVFQKIGRRPRAQKGQPARGKNGDQADGKDLSAWESVKGGAAEWDVHDGVFTVNKKKGDIQTKQKFNDFQMHIEWQVPTNITGESQSRGNSGIFLQGMYEVQVLDCYNNPTYVNGQTGSIYKQSIPLANAMRKPGEWNVYDIIYTAPTFKEDGSYRTHPTVTVIQNGVVLQNHTTILGTTEWIGFPQVKKHGAGPIILQSHGDPSEPISFRNIWIREL